jgi:hypothetical protein
MVIVDRYSGWTSIHPATTDGAKELVRILRIHSETFGTPEEVCTDGGSQFTSKLYLEFLKTWGITQRITSAYFPHGNSRAELAVKSVKRMMRENTGPTGTLNTDSFSKALMLHRNTPDRDSGQSPAEVIFGRQIKDSIPVLHTKYEPQYEWQLTSKQRELAFAKRHLLKKIELSEHTKRLPPLTIGNVVSIQNQSGPSQSCKKWDRSGVVVDIMGHDQYKIKVDGTGRITLRNRRFLQPIVPFKDVLNQTPSRSLDRARQERGNPAAQTPAKIQARKSEGAQDLPPTEGAQDLPEENEGAQEMPEETADEEVRVRRSTRTRTQTDFYRPAV